MATFKALSRGTQIVLAAGPLLLFSLFFTWQYVDVDYGPAGVAKLSMDGWDAWGLLLALLVLALVCLVAMRNFTEDVLSEDVPWSTICFGLGVAVFVLALAKNLTDAGSTWASYGFVALAGAVALGTWLDRASERKTGTMQPALERKRGLRSAA